MKFRVKCPCKINLDLKVYKKDEKTGYHPIESVMQTVNLYDYLTVETANTGKIELFGNDKSLLYDDSNLIIKAAQAFFLYSKISLSGIRFYLEKNIPLQAGLAGGSTDAAGTILALNYLYKDALSYDEIFEINKTLGSDINFCYLGGKRMCRGKGDDMKLLPYEKFDLTIVKPAELKISAKEAYKCFDELKEEPCGNNYLEYALKKHYPELAELSNLGFQMSGSGPSFFIKKTHVNLSDYKKYQIFENLTTTENGVELE